MENKIRWCMRKKEGIDIIKPNENLSKAYLLKAERALQSMRANKGNKEWEISSCYYTMYFSLYSILMKLGIKCEIHSCTIEFMRQFLNDFFDKTEIDLLSDAKEARNDVQYYTDREINEEDYGNLIAKAPDFMVKCKEVSSEIKEDDIIKIRNKLKEIKDAKDTDKKTMPQTP